jgi:hypothetical protein
MTLQPPAGEALSTRTSAVPPSVSTPLATPLACLAPSAQFGRPVQVVDDLSAKGPVAELLEHPALLTRSAIDLAPCPWCWMILLLPRDPYATICVRLT